MSAGDSGVRSTRGSRRGGSLRDSRRESAADSMDSGGGSGGGGSNPYGFILPTAEMLARAEAEEQGLPVDLTSCTYGSVASTGSDIFQHLADQAAHVDSLQHVQHKQQRNTFVPVVCSILGVVIFMRLGTVVGTLGLWYAGIAISMAFLITFLTVGSMSALVSTDDNPVDDAVGGLFSSLRRSLGHRLGHMIGSMLYASFCVGAAFYLLGFSEITLFSLGMSSTTSAYPLPWNVAGSWVTVAFASVLLAILTLIYVVGVRITRRALRVVFVMVMVAVVCNVLFLSVPSAATKTGMSMAHFRQNAVDRQPQQLRQMFATFFPGFCGVIAGANLAEHVAEGTAAGASPAVARKASQYFLVGVHKALAFSFVVYLVLGGVLAACVDNHALRNEPFVVPIVVDALLGVPLIFLGIAFTTLSSALSNIKGASTIFTALYAQSTHMATTYPTTIAEDNDDDAQLYELTPSLAAMFASTRSTQREEPATAARRPSVFALLCTWILCQAALLCGTVDAIIPVVSSTFLLTFFLLNFACFFQELSSATFRPSFRMYSKWTAFLGCLLSLGAFFLVVSTTFVTVSSALLLGYVVVYHRELALYIDELRVSQQNARRDAVEAQILADEVATPLGSFTPGPLRREGSEVEATLNKRIELAALYVRDAVHGRFLGEEYLLDGLNRTHYKRLFHGLRYVRVTNMCVLLTLTFFETPSWCYFQQSCGDRDQILTWDLPVLPTHASIAIELVCLSLLTLELSMKYKYQGPRMYFVNKWHILQIIFLLADFVSVLTVVIIPQDPVRRFMYHTSTNSHDESSTSKPLVLAPLIRPLLLITMSHRLRAGFSSLLKALPRFMDGLLTLAFLIVIYAVLGMVLFEGTEEVDAYFKTFGDACLNLIILLTTANFPDVMMPIYSKVRASSLFFISFLTIGQLLVMNLVFASVYQHYRQEIADRAMGYSTKRKLALQAAFHLLPAHQVLVSEDPDAHRAEVKVISRTTYGRLVNELMRPSISLFHHDDSASDEKAPLRSFEKWSDELESNWIGYDEFEVLIKAFMARQNKSTKRARAPREPTQYTIVNWMQRFVTTGWFDKVVDVIILGNLVAILVEIQAKIFDKEEVYLTWESWMPAFSIAYLLEMLLKMYAFRMGGYFNSSKNIYDCVVTLVIFVAEVSVHMHNTELEWEWIRLLLLLRFLRCLRLLVALQALSSMFAIVVRLIPAFTTLYGMLGVVMCEYAAIGTQLFGGKLVVGDPRLAGIAYGQANYYSNNFNDFASSLTTLFELLIVNNWFVTMEGAEAVTTKWSRIYFVSFYIFGVVMVLSLVVAFVVEAYFEDAAHTESAASNAPINRSESSGVTDTADPTNRDRVNSGEPFQRLLKQRSFQMKPRSDSIYIEEFL